MTEATMKVIAREPPKSARAPYLITVQDTFFENQKFVLRTWDKGLFDLCPLEAVRTFSYHTAPSNKGMLDYFLDAVKLPAEAPKPKREELVRIPEAKPKTTPPVKSASVEAPAKSPTPYTKDDYWRDKSERDKITDVEDRRGRCIMYALTSYTGQSPTVEALLKRAGEFEDAMMSGFGRSRV